MIDVSERGGLWRVTLDRPDKANALTAEMLGAVADAAAAAGFCRGETRLPGHPIGDGTSVRSME